MTNLYITEQIDNMKYVTSPSGSRSPQGLPCYHDTSRPAGEASFPAFAGILKQTGLYAPFIKEAPAMGESGANVPVSQKIHGKCASFFKLAKQNIDDFSFFDIGVITYKVQLCHGLYRFIGIY